MITIDGIKYRASWVAKSLTQTADIINGEGSGRLQGSYKMYLEYLGTFINHSGQLHRDADCTDEEWSNLFITLANPKNKHKMSFPFGVNQTITQEIYIAKISRALLFSKEKNSWETIYSVEVPSISAAWFPNGSIKGLI